MSAYGAISCATDNLTALRPTVWKVSRSVASVVLLDNVPQSAESHTSSTSYIVAFHLALHSTSAPVLDDLLLYLYEEFADEVERGMTYPQETRDATRYTFEEFKSYFFAADVILGIETTLTFLDHAMNTTHVNLGALDSDGIEVNVQLNDVRGERGWKDCVAGYYYIKPNYPGRSSHICNAGFVTPLAQRGKGFASVLAQSYLHYAPRLGYEASVFNLVYVNNVASVRIWEKLGFTKAGRIPCAGRLKRQDSQGEEYVDAWVFYKRFDPVNVDEAGKDSVVVLGNP